MVRKWWAEWPEASLRPFRLNSRDMSGNSLSYQEALRKALSDIEELLARKSTPMVLIDGRAGAGKSRFAADLLEGYFQLESRLPKLVHMDDLYTGWNGLRAGSLYVNQKILEPIRSGKDPTWQVWNWSRGERGASGEPSNGWRSFEGGNLLIVEGCGAISAHSATMADLCIWIDSDLATRRKRFSDRDKGEFDDFWHSWAIQEDEFYEAEKSQELCDLMVQN